MANSINDQEKMIRDAALRDLRELSLLLESDPELIESTPIADVRAELRSIGLDPDKPLPEGALWTSQAITTEKPKKVKVSAIPEHQSQAAINTYSDWGGTSMNLLKRFLLACSGVHWSILTRPECATEHPKYLGIGVLILFTSIISALSGGYALSLIFSSTAFSYALGVFWGISIFFLDRLILNFTKDERGVGWVLLKAMPRLLIYTILALITVQPILLKVFEGEIAQRIEQEKVRVSYGVSNVLEEINQLEAYNDSLRQELARKEERRNELMDKLMAEVSGAHKPGVSGKSGMGPYYAITREEMNRVAAELEEQRSVNIPLIQKNLERIERLKVIRERETEIAAATIQRQSVGLLAQLEAFRSLTADSSTLATVNWVLILAAVGIISWPLLTVVLSAPGPYDLVLKRMERQVMVREEREILNLEVQTYIDSEVNKELKKLILAAKLSITKDVDVDAVEAEFAPKLASEINRRLKERLEGLNSIFASGSRNAPTESSP